ncbi:MAG: hypothetical protein IT449_02030 [Phycisphaerales bacterium]|nr:hypothetical protein [Phycisphaerales bacterium]
MLRSKWFVRSMMALGLIVAVAIPVYAHCGHCAADCKTMVAKMDEAKTTLAKAIESAEAATKGRAVNASCHLADGKLSYTVYCSAGDKLSEVAVDAAGKAGAPKDVKEFPVAAEDHGKGDKEKGEKKEEKGDKKGDKKNGG